ncbi:glycosyltransferase family 2 protein [Caenimonas aquaedulcis]|uniref:Glycosyltransferase family 2 protein n=1 Tax=Caenimonas aquaedulcis TaxID=2793270 RepID=A0A931H5L1_9BURK|nr:glycosyltransferase family A protein [Caenimonas aquaedulcis]MBG9389065.1 glycosyltransferase family 2 protein [Caenimonas aquaedulcis]
MSMHPQPDLVSTIIPVFNRPAMLREAVASVIAQTWRPIEIIIVDDGSTDGTPEAARQLQEEHPSIVRVESQRNAGPGAARELGRTLARGEFVQFLDSDDLLLPDKFAIQVQGLRADPRADISYGRTRTEEQGVMQPDPAQRTGEVFRTLFPALLREPLWPTLTPLYRAGALQRIGPWPRLRQLEDWVYDAQAGVLGLELHHCGDAWIAVTRNHAGPRLCSIWQSDPSAMRERALAYERVAALAGSAGIDAREPEMQRFARSLFWMARTVGAQGLHAEAERLLRLALSIDTDGRRDLRAFSAATRVLGWPATARLARWIEALRAGEAAR